MSIKIIDNPKPKWMPRMYCEIVDVPFNVGRDYTWQQLDDTSATLSLAGCDGYRIFANSWEPYIEPCRKNRKGQYVLWRHRKKWDKTLKRFLDMVHGYHMGVYVDFNDNCSHKLAWNPFKNNKHKFSHSFYGYKALVKKRFGGTMPEVDFMIKHWDNRILKLLDKEKDVVSLGNELDCPRSLWNSLQELNHWARQWGVARALNIFKQGFPEPLMLSGSTLTAAKLMGWISDENDVTPGHGFTNESCAKQKHGLGLDKHVQGIGVPDKDKFLPSPNRVYAYSDDGVGTNRWNKISKNKQGYCETLKNGEPYACTANTANRIKCVEAFIDKIGDVNRCHSIAFLPREILYKGRTDLSRFDRGVSARIYTRIADRLWVVNIKRTLA